MSKLTKTNDFIGEYCFSRFVALGYNRRVHSGLQELASHKIFPSLVLLSGDTGCGKSHLIHALGQALRAEHPQKKTVLYSAENFLRLMKVQDRGSDFIFVEDIQGLMSQPPRFDELVDCFHTVWKRGAKIVASYNPLRREPDFEVCPKISQAAEALLSAAPVSELFELGQASPDEMVQILKQQAAYERQIWPSSLFMLLTSVSKNPRELLGFFHRLLAYSQLTDRPISKELGLELVEKLNPPEKHFTCPYSGLEFVLVPGGEFMMGDTFGDGNDDELPIWNVRLRSYCLSKYPVTQGQYERVLDSNPSFNKGEDNPVENVSWKDAFRFMLNIYEKTGLHTRFPTEWEWEFAARSGGRRDKWSGANRKSDLDTFAWHFGNSEGHTHPVGLKQPNGLGFYDMSGNVWEWCQNYYSADGYAHEFPRYPPDDTPRVMRGGSYGNYAPLLRSSSRCGFSPTFHDKSLGFRVACFRSHQFFK